MARWVIYRFGRWPWRGIFMFVDTPFLRNSAQSSELSAGRGTQPWLTL